MNLMEINYSVIITFLFGCFMGFVLEQLFNEVWWRKRFREKSAECELLKTQLYLSAKEKHFNGEF